MTVDHFDTKVIKWNSPLNFEPPASPPEANPVTANTSELYILLQGENGPCPLVALVNTLILREMMSKNPGTKQTFSSYTYGKDRVSVDSLLSRLGDVLAETLHVYSDHSASADTVFALLPHLVTGLNVNPGFDGSFEPGPSVDLFRLYGIDLVHGWICDSRDPAYTTINQVGFYDEAQSLILKANEEPENEQLQLAKYTIEAFLQENVTELTLYGLDRLSVNLVEDLPQVLFRNDHFSTVMKHNNTIYTLVTDMGFKNERNLVWQSLTSPTGTGDDFYDHLFQLPSRHESASTVPDSAQKDYDYAKQLQEKEDERIAAEMSKKYASRQQQQQKPAASNRDDNERHKAVQQSKDQTSKEQPSSKQKKKKPCAIM